jgi:AraC family transcriptional regulator
MSLVGRRNARIRDCARLADQMRSASVSVFSPTDGVSVEVTGEADVVQLFLNEAFAEAMLDAPFACPPMFDLRDDWTRATIMRVLVGSARRRPDDALMVDEDLQRLALRIKEHANLWRNRMEKPSALFRGGLSPAAFRRVEAMIEAALDGGGSPSLAEMADAIGLSVTHFVRAFRQQTGSPPHKYVVHRRMERAVSLLRVAQIPVGEVAEEVGFSTPAHFVATFRPAMGVTPGAMRDALAG